MLVFEALKTHAATVILLHGLGGSPDGTTSAIVRSVLAPALPHARFILPSAPTRAVGRLGGTVTRAWYDIPDGAGGDASFAEDIAGMDASARAIAALVRQEGAERGIAPHSVVIAGVSQGGAMAIYAAMHMLVHDGIRVAGVLSAIGYVAGAQHMRTEKWGARVPPGRSVPVLLTHGSDDPVILTPWHRTGANALRALFGGSLALATKEYAGVGHTVSEDMVVDSLAFIAGALAAPAAEKGLAMDTAAVRANYRAVIAQRRSGRIVRSGGCSLCSVS